LQSTPWGKNPQNIALTIKKVVKIYFHIYIIMDILKSIVILPILDFIYLKSVSNHFNKQILDVQKSEQVFRIAPAIVCYIALLFGLNYFILRSNKSRKEKIIDAILLGLVIYTVYETTNMAIFKDWNIKSVLIDSIWGGVVMGLTTFIVTI
jgi:uncharacterized membrane protein